MTAEFLITSLIIVASPGTGVVYTVAAGLAHGWRASIVAAFGCTLGIVPHMLAAVTGLAALLHESILAFEIVKYCGVAYLLWMAWSSLQSSGVLCIELNKAPRSPGSVILSGILLNFLNPKLSIFFLAFLPQFLAPREPNPMPRMLQLSLIFMAVTFAVFIIYGVFSASVRNHVLERPAVLRRMRYVFSTAFVLLAARLVWLH
ncbi:LysE family translocator [Paludibacterium yongneupense]|uniref:LysE family translocator n=1 Tax=Paludibacterium yongneupense TaxID=400061 RepID=UPI0004921ACF|nr:LysE family translocator [Paludibacterium yongneupense]